MGQRLPIYLPRIAVVVIAALAASAGLTFAAGQRMSAAPKTSAAPAAQKRVATIVVPDLRNQAFVFAKGQLADLGFAWRVTGGVQGFPANTVVGQSPAPGTKLVNTGAPLVTLTLAQNRGYTDSGTPEDASPYPPTPLRLADAAVAPVQKPAPKHAQPSKHVAAARPQQTQQQQTDAIPSPRPPDFVVPGGRKEPQNELPLPVRAAKLGEWLAAHPNKTNANVQHWLYQNEWVVAGARLGWWHGAEALRTLIAVDSRTQSLWGIGDKSEVLARRALAEVEARAK